MGMDVEEEEEVLFPPSYYVQSPCTTISINTPSFEFHTHDHDLSSPPQYPNNTPKTKPSTFSSSRCSSARESLMSNAPDSKLSLVAAHGTVVSGKDEGDDDENMKTGILGRSFFYQEKDDDGVLRSTGFRKYLSFGTYDGSVWLAIQLGWRFIVSLAAALLVFYLITNPPPPRISVKVGGIREFELAEGVDGSGVSTKIMRCNASIHILIDNHSKVFGLHILPPLLKMSFNHLTFAVSQGEKVVGERDHVTSMKVYLGTKGKPMYGAGRMMQDMLDSGAGLQLAVDVVLASNYRVVGELIRPWFHHHSRCLILIVKGYDNKHRTHHFSTTCSMIMSR
ncbi:hypothetical protein V2J09_018464 [Rumex salicifolius]